MPIYEYRCQDCGRKVSIFWRSLSAVDEKDARCERCGSRRLTRLASRVRVIRGGGSSGDFDGSGDDALLDEMAGLDENDPRALGRFMRKMAQESGEDLGPEFDEVVSRLERGEDPEQIEKSMGDLFGDDLGGSADMGLEDDSGAPPEDSTAKADKEAEEQDRKATERRRTVPMKATSKRATKSKAKKSKKK
ncbi:MAG: zinc ribbon domain-containing protein [Thermoflexales bacterium]|nr:zinc ribbon domain-containing protein [Thermoflexales bacterium]MDW8352264.1 zinc ribbon domain-containing protein [Anaerolineae bacterium]